GLELAREELADHVAGTFLEGSPVVEVAATQDRGLDELRAQLDLLLDRAPEPVERGRPRLWVDRSFSIKGAGTVVTGTLGGGSLAVGDSLSVVDREGRALSTRVRGLQSQEQARDSVGPGQRVAVNVTGVHHDALGRGAVLVREGQWRPTRRFDATVRTLPGFEIGNRGALLAYLGTTEQPVRLRLLEGRERIEGGESGAVRVWLERPLPLLPGDRFVLRDTGRSATVAGGEVLDLHPTLPVSRAHPDRSVERVIAERQWIEVDELEALTGVAVEPTVGHWVVAPAALAAAAEEVLAAVDAAGPLGADVAALDERLRAVLPTVEGVVVERGRVTRAGAVDPLANHPWLATLEASLFAPPPPDDVPKPEVRDLVRRGLVVEEDGCYFAVAALEEARQRIAAHLEANPPGITMSDLRQLLGTSRKFAVPIATLLDRRGVTVRQGDVRVAGRRMDAPVVAVPSG
ncbi:MAG: selB, partial [Ilumatobacteraceae bacterium]|nr:selB [Ilumatobacteraceae bacterium]